MDTVVLDGIQYVKASVVAKRFRYTTDYVGQLCRNKKIDARLVGRTWFVNPESVQQHRKQKHSKPEASMPVNADHTGAQPVAKKRVVPVISGKAARQVERSTGAKVMERQLKVQYEPDDEALLPTLRKRVKQPPKRLRIEHFDPTRVKVAGSRSHGAHFAPTALPDIALSGKLSVETVTDTEAQKPQPEAASKVDIPSKNKDISPERVVSDPASTLLPKTATKTVPKITHIPAVLQGEAAESVPVHVFQGAVMPPVARSESSAAVVSESIRTRAGDSKVSTRQKSSGTTHGRIAPAPVWLRIAPLLATLLAAVVIVGLFAASAQVAARDATYTSAIVFQWQNVLELFAD